MPLPFSMPSNESTRYDQPDLNEQLADLLNSNVLWDQLEGAQQRVRDGDDSAKSEVDHLRQVQAGIKWLKEAIDNSEPGGLSSISTVETLATHVNTAMQAKIEWYRDKNSDRLSQGFDEDRIPLIVQLKEKMANIQQLQSWCAENLKQ